MPSAAEYDIPKWNGRQRLFDTGYRPVVNCSCVPLTVTGDSENRSFSGTVLMDKADFKFVG
jgi:hypothetical protein